MSAVPSKPTGPYKPTVKEIKRIMKYRSMGIYEPKDVFNEAWISYNSMEDTDVCFTLQHITGRFRMLNLRELLIQIKLWKDMGVVCLSENINERKFGDKTAWSVVIQLPDLEDCKICPLSLAFETMVSGCTYVVRDKVLLTLFIAS